MIRPRPGASSVTYARGRRRHLLASGRRCRLRNGCPDLLRSATSGSYRLGMTGNRPARRGHRVRSAALLGIACAGIAAAGCSSSPSAPPPSPAAGKVVLAGHSAGGAVAHAAADARPDRVARVIYVDSGPLGDGGVINDGLPASGGEIPLPGWSLFGKEDLTGLDDGLRAAFRERAIPTPERVARDPQHLSDERRYDVPVTVIACEFSSAMLRELIGQGHPCTRELAKIRDVGYVDLPTGHWPQFTRPADLGQAILAIAGPA